MAKTLAQIKKAFGKRLTDEMLAQGYSAPRAKIKADAVILQEKAGVKSLEMARRYIKGESMPDNPKIIRNICKWLNVRESWLLRGELPKTTAEYESTIAVDAELLSACMETVLEINERFQIHASRNALSHAISLIYLEVMRGEKTSSDNQLRDMLKLFDQNSATK